MKKLIVAILMVGLLPAISFSWQPEVDVALIIAKQEGKRIGYTHVIQGIMIQESVIGGKLDRIGDDGQSIGVGQMQLSTAKWLINYHFGHPLASDETIKKLLLTNDRFALRLSALYFKYLVEYYDGNVDKAILAYNVGQSRVNKYGLKFDPNDYLRKVKKNISMMK